jgi:hypothetical protein
MTTYEAKYILLLMLLYMLIGNLGIFSFFFFIIIILSLACIFLDALLLKLKSQN